MFFGFLSFVFTFLLRGDNLVLDLDLLTSFVKVCMYHVTCSLVRSFHRRSPVNVHSCFLFFFDFLKILSIIWYAYMTMYQFVHSLCWFVNMCQWTNSRVGWCIVQVWNIISWIFIILSYAHYHIIYDIKCLNALLIFFFYFMKTRFTQVQSLKKGRQLEIDEITLT